MLAVQNVPSPGRWLRLENWCEAEALAIPNKGTVAHRIADQRSERKVVATERAEMLRELHDGLAQIFAASADGTAEHA